MPYEELRKKFPEEGSRCLKNCGKCCIASAPLHKKEAQAIGNWLVEHKSYEEIAAQLRHFDDQPDRCPFLMPDKGCFVYPVRPMVCVMFGHLPDTPGVPKHMSQQCPEKVEFTQVMFDEFFDVGQEFFLEMGEHLKVMDLRGVVFECEDGKERMVPVKEGSKMDLLRKATHCYRCKAEFPRGAKAYLESGTLVCQTCEDNMEPTAL